MNLKRQFIRYVSQNILAMIGMSCYILADTYFISVAAGSDGITVLNLALPFMVSFLPWVVLCGSRAYNDLCRYLPASTKQKCFFGKKG